MHSVISKVGTELQGVKWESVGRSDRRGRVVQQG